MPPRTSTAPLSTSTDPTQPPEGRDLEVLAEDEGGGAISSVRKHGLWSWFEQGHWLGRWRSPLLVKLWRYGAGSVVAFVTSGVALFVCIQWLGLGATTGAVIAFFAGAVPNWVLNRRWAWQKRHRDGIGKETSLYTVVSLVSLGVSVAATKATAVAAEHMGSHNTFKHLLVTGVYLLVTIALAGAKYVVYDRWVFVDRRDRSRHQVPTTTDVNRTP